MVLARRDEGNALQKSCAIDVTRMMVHDLRNPDGTILTASSCLAADSASILSSEQHQTLQIARTSAQRMLDLVNGILDVNQLESGQISLDWARIQLDQLVDRDDADISSRRSKPRI